MYRKFVNNLDKLDVVNGTFSLISSTMLPEEQKPFFALLLKGAKDPLVGFVVGNDLFITPFKLGCSYSVIARLRTLLVTLDAEITNVDIPLYIVRHGIPLKQITFNERKLKLTEIDIWKAVGYHHITKRNYQALFRDLRDTLYI